MLRRRTYTKILYIGVIPLAFAGMFLGSVIMLKQLLPGASAARPYLTGLVDRQGPPGAANSSTVKSFVIMVYWNQVQPSSRNDIVTTSIDSQLATANATGAKVKFRIMAGIYAPDWAKALGGGAFQLVDPDTGAQNTVGRFWTAEYRDAYNNFQKKLAAKYDSNPTVLEVTLSRCTTIFAEPFIRQASSPVNITAYVNAGFTQAADKACHHEQISDSPANWPTMNFDIAFNPYQGYDDTTLKTLSADAKVAFTKEVIDYCRAQLGVRCVLGNNSLRDNLSSTNPQDGPMYDEMYNYIKQKGPPIYFQTATADKIGDWQTALDKAVQLGAQSLELPAGYGNWDKTALSAFTAKLVANVYLPADTSSGNTAGNNGGNTGTNTGGNGSGAGATGKTGSNTGATAGAGSTSGGSIVNASGDASTGGATDGSAGVSDGSVSGETATALGQSLKDPTKPASRRKALLYRRLAMALALASLVAATVGVLTYFHFSFQWFRSWWQLRHPALPTQLPPSLYHPHP